MGKLFGTDGIRGKANVYPITPDLSLRLGKAIAAVLVHRDSIRPESLSARTPVCPATCSKLH
jgi:phosphomannomutase